MEMGTVFLYSYVQYNLFLCYTIFLCNAEKLVWRSAETKLNFVRKHETTILALQLYSMARAGHIFFKISGPLILAGFPLCEISGSKL
jgi:hypothetical protein